MARLSSVVSKLYALCKYFLAISVGITLKTIYDPPVRCSCPEVCVEPHTRSFEQQIFESNLHTQLHEPFQPTDASEVIQYEFFNASVVADYPQNSHVGSLRRIDKLDIANMVSQVTALLGSSGRGDRWRITRLENGYRRLDLVRGLEYVIDVGVSSDRNRTSESRKLHLVRPFGVMHLLSNVAVDGTKLVHFVIAVSGLTTKLRQFLSDLEGACDRGNDRAYLLIVVCSNTTAEMEDVRTFANAVQRQHRDAMHIRIVHTRRQFNVALALDLGSRQLPGSALIVFMDVEVRFNREAVRRCQLHAVEGYSVYYPVVFAQYDPDIVQQFSPPGTVDNPDIINQYTGEWAVEDYSIVCMYAVDYRVVGGYNLSAVDFQFDLYQHHVASGLRVFRSPDLGLVRPFNDACSKAAGKNQPNVCQTKHLGSQYQLTQMLSAVQ